MRITSGHFINLYFLFIVGEIQINLINLLGLSVNRVIAILENTGMLFYTIFINE